MKRNTIGLHARFLVLLVLTVPLLNGCTLIGLSLGRTVAGDKVYPRENVRAVPKGSRVEVQYRGGQVVSGRFVGLGELSDEEYASVYAGMNDAGALPPLGAPLRVQLTSGEAFTGAFGGFDGQPPVLGLRVEEHGQRRTLLLSRLQEMAGAPGSAYDRATLDRLVRDDRIPTRRALVIAASPQERRIPLHDVNTVIRPGRKNAVVIGTTIGLAIDLFLIYIVSQAEYEYSHTSSDQGFDLL